MENEVKMNLPQKSVVVEDSQLMVILEKALTNPDITLEKMNGLLDFQLRLEKRKDFKEFNVAMVKAIGEIPSFERSKSGHNYKYSTFESINQVVKPILKENDLFMRFNTDFDEDGFVKVTAIIAHKNGYSEKTTFRLPFDKSGSKNDVQAVGSAVSYGKRYAQNALLNITTHGEDDDGFASTKKITTKQIENLNKGIQSSGVELSQLLQFMKVEKLSDILMDDYIKAYNFIKHALEAKKEMELAHDNK